MFSPFMEEGFLGWRTLAINSMHEPMDLSIPCYPIIEKERFLDTRIAIGVDVCSCQQCRRICKSRITGSHHNARGVYNKESCVMNVTEGDCWRRELNQGSVK